MAKNRTSTKHLQIDKANHAVIAATAIAVGVFVFGIFLGRAMILRQSHQGRVIKEKEAAVKILKDNIEAKNRIVDAYKVFNAKQPNLLGGDSTTNGVGDRDGDNTRLILDALPSKYDFPALVTSVEKMLSDNGYAIESIKGTDDEVNQSKEPQANPQPVEMAFEVEVTTPHDSAQQLVELFEKSIRPFNIRTLDISVDDKNLKITIEAISYYQPQRAISISKKVVK
jgi:hypothetical protein